MDTNKKMSDVEMTVKEVECDELLIDMPETNTSQLISVSEEQLTQSFKITSKTIQFIKQFLEIISQRNTFKIDEFKIVGTFYETILNTKDEIITGESIQKLLTILQTSSKRGTFHLNELIIISELYKSIRDVIT